jgi:hypothetical protein
VGWRAPQIVNLGFSSATAPIIEGFLFRFVARRRMGRSEGRHVRHSFMAQPSFRRSAPEAGSRRRYLGLAAAVAFALSLLDRPCTTR